MKPSRQALALSVVLLACAGTGRATAAELAPVMNANGCNNCHAQSEQVVGPSFDAIRQKYSGQPGALAMLEHKVRTGGSGVWGQVAMPPNPKISDADLHWLLSQVLSGSQSPQKHP
jgi:cytochrome c